MPIKPENRMLYSPDWPLISWLVRFFRAAGRCEWTDPETGQRCERCDGEPIPGNEKGSKTVLTTAHLDHNPQNNNLTNLLALCQYHHLKHDAGHHALNATATRTAKKASFYKGNLFTDAGSGNNRNID